MTLPPSSMTGKVVPTPTQKLVGHLTRLMENPLPFDRDAVTIEACRIMGDVLADIPGASFGPGSYPSDEAPSGLPAFGASIPRAQWQPGEPVSRSEYVRVIYDDKGHLDEVVTDGGAHLEHMGGKNWWLACHRRDGSTFAVWFTGKITMTEEQEAPASAIDAEGQDAQRLGAQHESAVGNAETPMLEGLPVHRLCAESNGCILMEEKMEACCGSDACLLRSEVNAAVAEVLEADKAQKALLAKALEEFEAETLAIFDDIEKAGAAAIREAVNAAYERAAEIANEVEAEMDRRLAKLKPPNADLASACAVGAGWATAKVSARILALKEPT